MVRIQKLEMQGFKSFARKTTVLFPSNFSCICGPNGSGKSNILDAVCFVLGRTSAKSMRASRIHEMIFNGTGGKPPAEFAKVAIYFDNADRVLPVEQEQVCISRRVNRKGISIYKLNGRTVTREKILEILRPAHIRPDGHNIILQGDVTEIIEMSPLERREVIDEVSGIAEFDAKKERAQRELATVEDRLREASIILNERAAAMAKLEAEALAAEKYKSLTEQLDKLRASLAKRKLADAEAAMALLNKKIVEKDKELEKFNIELAKTDRELEKAEQELADLGARLIDRSADIAVIKELEKLRAQIARKRDRIELATLERKRLQELITRLKLLQRPENPAINGILRLGRADVYGTIGSLSRVPAKYRTAIEIAAGGHLSDIIVACQDTAIDCVRWLKKSKLGRATFLPLDKISEKSDHNVRRFLGQPGVLGLASDLIEFDRKYFKAFSNIFGGTLVVDHIETAKRIGIGTVRMVTLDGDLAERSGAIIGGFYRAKKGAFVEGGEIARYARQKKTLAAEIEQLQNEIAGLASRLEELAAAERAGGEKLQAALRQRQKLEERCQSLRLKKKDIAESKMQQEAELQNLKVKKARLEAELDNVKAEFANYSAKTEFADLATSTLERKIRESITAIGALGAINQRAPAELAELKPAYLELKSRVDRLAAERDRVIQMMAEIEGKRKDTFLKALTAIAEQFRAVYKDLTGGDGKLQLEDPDNITSGLLIEASLPGRNILNIDSMSGGEKTLTALAFLFAIQRSRPAPFYILDEIDAALDKPNTKKTVDLIKRYSASAQFIIISHNDTTVAAADCVYGCSMENGESKLVGISMPK